MTEATNSQALREVDEVEVGSTYKCQQGPWNPGIKSQLPRTLLPMCTVFRPENVYTTLAAAEELRDFTGMELHDLVTFKPERLVVHELLVRVTADIAVSDGSQYEDLGINFRRITQTILTRYVEPQMPALKSAYNEFRARTLAIVEREVAHVLDAAQQPVVHSEAPPRTGFRAFMSLFRRAPKANAGPSKLESRDDREAQAIARWQLRSSKATDPTEAAACHSLAVVATAIRSRHGCLWGDGSLLARLACDLACNERGSVLLGELIEPHVLRAVESEGFDLLPGQAKPVVMNTKGASASGKSTMRPMQKRLSNKIGVRWRDFALISPDIWRKFLLDYASLGDAFKYAGTFTGHELSIVDGKLDQYVARKARAGRMSHLLIDRFRFDSFATSPELDGSNLLTRFGHEVYIFFMVTPPEATVERAWTRGLNVGRYKAVDDLLDHNIEAYTGMPQLFLALAQRTDRPVHYEFLDNSVPLGELPRTIAFGKNREMNVLDVSGMLNVDRFRKIDVHATKPEEVYSSTGAMAPGCNLEFLTQCARSMAMLNFAERDSGRVYARFEHGTLKGVCPELLERALKDPDTRTAVLALAPHALEGGHAPVAPPRTLSERSGEDVHTLGRWRGV